MNPDAPAPPAAAPIAPADAPTVAVAADPDIKDKDKDKGKDAVRAKDAGKDPAGPAATHADPTPSDSTPVTATPEASAPELEPPDAASASIAADPLPLMPHPTQIPPGNPDDPADAPGTVPPGDSRSLRRGDEFVLVYRVANIVVSRFGPVGKRGQFRVVEYPTTSYASNAYARECSRWVSEGFSDYRGP